jgi:protoporphyrinogen oxidase
MPSGPLQGTPAARPVAVIAGAGPAGLTAAAELLARTNVRPIVFEATQAIGGLAQTVNYKGNRIDIGGHRFFSKNQRVMEWWFKRLPREGTPGVDATRDELVMLQRSRLSRIYYRRHFFPYPIAITLATARQLGGWNSALIALSYLRARLLPLRDETYLDAFFINRFGRRLYETFFRDYTEKVWGVKCGTIRADWGAQRVKGLSLTRAAVHAVRDLFTSTQRLAQHKRETSLITQFYYPKYGPGQMWETVARDVLAAGGEIQPGHRVVAVHLDGARVTSVEVEHAATLERRRVACDHFFSTMPVRELIKGLSPAPPAEVRDVAAGLQYRDFLTVGLLLRNLHVNDDRGPVTMVHDNWIYVQDGAVRVGRIQIFNNWSPAMVADPKHTVWIGLEYFVTEDDELWGMRDADLVALGGRELETIGVARRQDVLDGCVIRVPKAYPAYMGTYDRLNTVRDWTTTIPNLFLIGRNGMHRYNNQDHSMLTAMMAVDNIVEGRTNHANLWDVNLEMEYHEERKLR